MYGTQVSLSIGLVAVALSTILGIFLGGISGYFGGLADLGIQRVIELLQSIPPIPIWLALTATLPRSWSVEQTYLAITVILALIGWTTLGREVRGRFLSLREEDFVVAAKLSGSSRMRIVFRHMLPSMSSHIIAAMTLADAGNDHQRDVLELSRARPAPTGDQLGRAAAGGTEPAVDRPGALAAAARPRGDHHRARAEHPGRRSARRLGPLSLIAMDQPLLSVRNLKTFFMMDEGTAKAVDGVSFDVQPGQVVGIVGESGCGKSVTIKSVLRIVQRPGRIVGGEILFRRPRGNARDQRAEHEIIDLATLDANGKEMRAIRGSEIALIPQEPMAAMSPVHTIGNQLVEAVQLHRDVSKPDAERIVIARMREVGVPSPHERMTMYPWELSGGLRQRVMIAMALSCDPKLLIADEPTTAIDVTTQAQVLSLLRGLQAQHDMAIIFITHDLGVIAQIADYVVVMYLGRVMETGPVDDIFHRPQHPYTRALLESIPTMYAPSKELLPTIVGSIPHPFNRPAGCPFYPRCADYMPGTCDRGLPALLPINERQSASCFLYHSAVDED